MALPMTNSPRSLRPTTSPSERQPLNRNRFSNGALQWDYWAAICGEVFFYRLLYVQDDDDDDDEVDAARLAGLHDG